MGSSSLVTLRRCSGGSLRVTTSSSSDDRDPSRKRDGPALGVSSSSSERSMMCA